MDRYDRQKRLWGASGQQGLRHAYVCVIGGADGGLWCEVVKNLALSGVGAVRMISVGSTEDSYERFFEPKELRALNAEVSWTFCSWTSAEMAAEHWCGCSALIVTAGAPGVVAEVTAMWRERRTPMLLLAHCASVYGYVRLLSPETHCVIEAHPPHRIPELQLYAGWKELDELCERTSVSKLDSVDRQDVPFAILLRNVMRSPGKKPASREEVRAALDKLYPSHHTGAHKEDLNFIEAVKYAHLALIPPDAVPSRVSEAWAMIPRDVEQVCDPLNKQFWVLMRALQQYFTVYRCMPLSGELPDMESSTERYYELKECYEQKAKADRKRLAAFLPPAFQDDLIDTVCRNLRYLRVIRPSELSGSDEILSELRRLNTDSGMLLSVLLSIQYGIQELTNNLKELEYLNNIKRFSGSNFYPTVAFVGGVLAQEATKFLTHQYVPIENTFVYDGLLNTTETFMF
ncbi:AaceriAGL005Wp [[Ashbya] aceris (nom. inval.)]|nr:AaceriAGL005Wp [[Ashbya] aceris (nom. inval.)]